jgi:hypothetical protein
MRAKPARELASVADDPARLQRMRVDRQRAFVVFALAVLAFHHLPTIDLVRLGILIDLFTPLVVVGAAAAVLLAERPHPLVVAFAFVAAVAYVEGHGIHLAANAINGAEPVGEAGRRAEFWDERFGHVEWHLGWFGLLLAFCLAERARPGAWPRLRRAALPVAALGFTLFTSTVEGQTWPLLLAAGAGFAGWAALARRPLLTQCAAAFGLAAALIGVWALWQGGVPEFTDVWDV